jgi:DNA-binding transcriptional MerR regulator
MNGESVMGDERRAMTQDELLTEMHRLGYDDVTERQVADWRRKYLLPPFDVIGGGRGQRRGRERSSWTNGKSVLNQALWVRELLQIYRSMESVRLPLWVLGYPVPLKRVREALSRPLNEIANNIADAIENESRASGEIEDMIGEATYQHVEEMRHEGAEALLLPQHSLEAFFNIFLNQGYVLTDGAFELGVEELQDYERAMRERQDAALAAEGFSDTNRTRQDNSLLKFIDRAPFIKQYFSLHQLKQAVDECTDNDLRAVQHDLSYLRGMALMLRKIIMILTREIPADYQPARADILRPILSAGALLILADLSLRRNGFGQTIDYFLPEALRQFQKQFTEEMERELVEASKQIPEIIETSIPIIVNSILQESGVGQRE